MKNKKAQHEIMGFVLIVIIVSIIGLIFLSLMIGRGGQSRQTSVEYSNLLEAGMYYTSDCRINFNYEQGKDLIKSCYNRKDCEDGRKACDALNSTFKELIESSLKFGELYPNKAYKLSIYHKDLSEIDPEPNQYILKTGKGIFKNCSVRTGASHFIPLVSLEQSTLNIELEICQAG